jgi:hypothetical protein
MSASSRITSRDLNNFDNKLIPKMDDPLPSEAFTEWDWCPEARGPSDPGDSGESDDDLVQLSQAHPASEQEQSSEQEQAGNGSNSHIY